jgi:hypothetical protein
MILSFPMDVVRHPELITELAAVERFQCRENDVICRLASRACGRLVRDRWAAILILQQLMIPLPPRDRQPSEEDPMSSNVKLHLVKSGTRSAIFG